MARKKTIVVVDDEPDTAEMFAEMMRLSGFEVYKCYRTAQAIKTITKKMPDAVVLDIMMPGASGYEVLKYMRSDPKLARIPVVVTSAKSMPSDIRRGLSEGASVYLTKPVAFQDLKKAVEKVLR